MSVLSFKRQKTKCVLQIKCWIDSFVTKGHSGWSQYFAENILKSYNPIKSWKGKLIINKDYFVVKSRSKTYIKKYKFSQLYGLLSSSFNKKFMVLGILEEDMLYLVLRFNSMDHKDRVIDEMNIIKGPDKSDVSRKSEIIDMNSTNDELSQQYHFLKSNKYDSQSQTSETPNSYTDFIRSSNASDGIIREETVVRSTLPLDLEDPDWDVYDSSGVLWIEDTKYLDYKATLGKHIEAVDGSIFMYCAHQIVPENYWLDYTDSDSDNC